MGPVSATPQDLLHHLLAISATEEDVIKKNIAGYVCVKEVDMDKVGWLFSHPHLGSCPNFSSSQKFDSWIKSFTHFL